MRDVGRTPGQVLLSFCSYKVLYKRRHPETIKKARQQFFKGQVHQGTKYLKAGEDGPVTGPGPFFQPDSKTPIIPRFPGFSAYCMHRLYVLKTGTRRNVLFSILFAQKIYTVYAVYICMYKCIYIFFLINLYESISQSFILFQTTMTYCTYVHSTSLLINEEFQCLDVISPPTIKF